jgi:multiple sugar transport system ATP-binding protein
MPLVRLQRLARLWNINGAQTGLTDFSGLIGNGALHVVLGPSGAGKTTLLRIIAGLEKPDSGTILFDEKDVTHVPAKDRDVSVVFQQSVPLPHISVAENLALPLQLRKVSKAEIKKRVEEMADKLGIRDWLERPALDLSGGEAQKVCLGRALIRQTSLLLLDEPFAHLDQPRRLEFRRFLKRLQNEFKTTIVFVTHDQAEASSLATECSVIIEGKNHQSGTFQSLCREPASASVAKFMGLPPMNTWPSNSFPFKFPQVDGECIIGVPAINLQTLSLPGFWKLRASDVVYESHGPMSIGHGIMANGLAVTFSIPADDEARASELDLFFDPERVFFFSATSGQRLDQSHGSALASGA